MALTAVNSKHQMSVDALAEIASDMSQLGPAFDLLSQCESSRTLNLLPRGREPRLPPRGRGASGTLEDQSQLPR